MKGIRLVEKDLNSKKNLDHILRLDIGYTNLKVVHTSRYYFLGLHRNLYEMIRKLGSPMFFVSFISV
jgi:hypothetical protein